MQRSSKSSITIVGYPITTTEFCILNIYFSIQTSIVQLPVEGKGDLRLFNGYECPLKIAILPGTKEETKFKIKELGFYVEKNLMASRSYAYRAESKCAKNNIEGTFIIKSKTQASYYFKDAENKADKTTMTYFVDDATKSEQRDPKIRIFLNSPNQVWIRLKFESKIKFQTQSFNFTKIEVLPVNTYDVIVQDRTVCQVKAQLGGVYTVMLMPKNGTLYYVRLENH